MLRARSGALAVSTVLAASLMANLFLMQGQRDRASFEASQRVPTSPAVAHPSGSKPVLGLARASANGPAANGQREVAVINAAQALELARSVQTALSRKGYEPGPADGVPGLMTRAALMAFEYDHGLPLTARVTQERLGHLTYGVPESLRRARTPGADVVGHAARDVILTVQQSLKSVGYHAGPVDGAMSLATMQAIRDFEADRGLTETGRVSGRLMAQLVALANQGKLALKY